MRAFALLIVLAALTAACGKRQANEKPIGDSIEIQAPLGLPPVPVPKDNPVTAASIALGRKLFYERKLSADTTLT